MVTEAELILSRSPTDLKEEAEAFPWKLYDRNVSPFSTELITLMEEGVEGRGERALSGTGFKPAWAKEILHTGN